MRVPVAVRFEPSHPGIWKVTNNVALSVHAADVLKALISTQGHPVASPEHSRLFLLSMEIVLRRCFPKIKHRVFGAKYLFGIDLIPRLESWTPGPADTLNVASIGNSKRLLSGLPAGEMWVEIPPNLLAVFDKCGIPKQLRDGVSYYQFNLDTASGWLRSLVVIFRRLQEVTKNHKDGDRISYFYLYEALDALYSYLYDLHAFLDVILQIPSLICLLNSLRPTPELRGFRGSGHGDGVVGPGGTSSNVRLHMCI